MAKAIRIQCPPQLRTYKELNINLVGFFMPQKMHQKCTDPVSTHFYGRFSNPKYPILSIPLLAPPDSTNEA